MSTHLSPSMEKEVSRTEILNISGLAVASISGLGTLFKRITGTSLLGSPCTNRGYASSTYGGSKDGC